MYPARLLASAQESVFACEIRALVMIFLARTVRRICIIKFHDSRVAKARKILLHAFPGLQKRANFSRYVDHWDPKTMVGERGRRGRLACFTSGPRGNLSFIKWKRPRLDRKLRVSWEFWSYKRSLKFAAVKYPFFFYSSFLSLLFFS